MNTCQVLNLTISDYENKLGRKENALSEYQLCIESGQRLNEVEYAKREVLLAEISLIKIMLNDLISLKYNK